MHDKKLTSLKSQLMQLLKQLTCRGNFLRTKRPMNRYKIVDPIQPYDIVLSPHGVSPVTSNPKIAPNPMYANGAQPPQVTSRNPPNLPPRLPPHFPPKAEMPHQSASEAHELRMKIHQLESEKKQLQTNLEESHIHMKQLNSILVEKKEAILKYQEQISDLQAENGDLRLQARFNQQSPVSVTPGEQALQRQLQQVRGQLTDSERRVTELRQTNAQLQVQASQCARVQDQTLVVDGMRVEIAQLRDENQRLMSRVQVLNHQVSTYSEDFQSERTDRERAQGAIHTLQSEGETLRQVIQIMAQDHNIRLENYGMGKLANHIQDLPQL